MTGKSADIAQAAANAGFDPSNLENLKALVNAIREADRAIYPDYYTGQAKYNDGLYPDRWKPAALRETKRVAQTYREFDTRPCVPTFIFGSDEMLRNLSRQVGATHKRSHASGANLVPLPLALANKRARKDSPPQHAQKRKRARHKRKATVSSTFLNNKEMVIDLTAPSFSNLPLRPANKTCKENRRENPLVHELTKDALYSVLSSLQANKDKLNMNREILRKQWEIDQNLQYRTITGDLHELNGYFVEAQNKIDSAMDLVEQRLL